MSSAVSHAASGPHIASVCIEKNENKKTRLDYSFVKKRTELLLVP
jgi:hypothetical protein